MRASTITYVTQKAHFANRKRIVHNRNTGIGQNNAEHVPLQFGFGGNVLNSFPPSHYIGLPPRPQEFGGFVEIQMGQSITECCHYGVPPGDHGFEK